MKTLVIGLGNPILGDDGAGWRVAERVQELLGSGHHGDVEVECASLGGLSLMERLAGCRRAILIDAISTGLHEDGFVSVLPLQALADPFSGHTASAHDTSLITALRAGLQLGLDLPETITVVAIEAATVHDFSEELSPAVVAAVPVAVQAVLSLVSQ